MQQLGFTEYWKDPYNSVAGVVMFAHLVPIFLFWQYIRHGLKYKGVEALAFGYKKLRQLFELKNEPIEGRIKSSNKDGVISHYFNSTGADGKQLCLVIEPVPDPLDNCLLVFEGNLKCI